MDKEETITKIFNKYKKIEIKPDEFMGLKQYIFLRKLLSINPILYRELILNHTELVGKVYTPEVGTAIKYFHIIRQFFPASIGPFVIDIDDILGKGKIEDLQNTEFRLAAKKRLKNLIISFAIGRYNYFAEKTGQAIFSNDNSTRLKDFLSKLIIVVTDSERILGIGDQGRDGAEISFGKLNCYYLGIGFNPSYLLPLGIDVGTNNRAKLDSALYDGMKHLRLNNQQYYPMMQLALEAISELSPRLMQFEDFKGARAWNILDWFTENIDVPCFNDDSQGTGAVVLSGIMSAERLGIDLKDSYFLFYGAGGAAIGLAQQIEWYLEENGMDKEEAKDRIIMIDSSGVLYEKRELKHKQGKKEFESYQKQYVLSANSEKVLIRFMQKKHDHWKIGEKISAEEAVECFGTNILIGTTTQPGIFTPALISLAKKSSEKRMKKQAKLLCMPLSNPTHKCEILSKDESHQYTEAETEGEQLYILKKAVTRTIDAAKGEIIIGTGSPFPSVDYKGKNYEIGQANNIFIFPGLAYGIVFSGVRKVTKQMFLATAKGLSSVLDEEDIKKNRIYPLFEKFYKASERVAAYVALAAINDKDAKINPLLEKYRVYDDEKRLIKDLIKEVADSIWYNRIDVNNLIHDENTEKRTSDFDFERIRKDLITAKELEE
ncbi:MAG: hypothetical protein KKF44_10730 [Nanoarchaeota archaeon]|nr:hypothetical protein [Nanoarchaeota archaeon]